MKIYIIAGKAKSGKTTFANYLREELKNKSKNPCVMQITGPLYGYAANYFDWDPNSNDKPREFLQRMGVEVIKEKLGKKTFLLDRLNEDIEILKEYFDTFIIADARFPEEFKYFEDKYEDVCKIQLVRQNYDDKLTDNERQHITEIALDEYDDYNYIVENEGLESLENTAKFIVENETRGE